MVPQRDDSCGERRSKGVAEVVEADLAHAGRVARCLQRRVTFVRSKGPPAPDEPPAAPVHSRT
jgi:hypothetical protein